jgi:hypothetical protein
MVSEDGHGIGVWCKAIASVDRLSLISCYVLYLLHGSYCYN